MRRRGKLTREEREKRQARRERRVPRVRPEVEEFVRCENCGLSQPRGNGYIRQDGLVIVAPCTNCRHIYARTPHYSK